MSPSPPAPPESPAGPSLWRLTGVFLRLGAQAFGGLGATLGLLERDLVAHRRWVGASDLRDSLTYTKPLPGSTVVQVVTYLGWRLRGPAGAVAATVAFLTPAVLVMTAAAAGTAALPDVAWYAVRCWGCRSPSSVCWLPPRCGCCEAKPDPGPPLPSRWARWVLGWSSTPRSWWAPPGWAQ